MKPVTFHNAAFSPFFDTPIAVEGERVRTSNSSEKVAGSFMACIFDNGFDTPFTEADVESTIRTYSVSIMAGDWLEKQPPQVGDKIFVSKPDVCTPDLPNMVLAVSHIDSLVGDTWVLTAKEVEQ